MRSPLATDLYQLTMMAGYYHAGIAGRCSFELFVRDLPPHRNFLVAAGIEQALEYLEQLSFSAEEIRWLRTVPGLSRAPSSFFDELAHFRFSGDVWAVEEGEPIFAHEPILRVTAPAAEAQLVETALLATVNFQTSIASKAVRIVAAARGRQVIEFGSRRAHGLDAALHAARAAFLAGCVGSSNVESGFRFGVPVSGTMAHSWVMTFADEVQAFRSYLELFGRDTTLLIDTYDTVAAARAIVAHGLHPAGVRIDSGDLAALSREVRRILDDGGLASTRIIASGDLDEHKIATLLAEGAPIDAFGVGTALATSADAPALGGVYKLVEVERDGTMTPELKLSAGKRTYPGPKQVTRVTSDGRAEEDVIGLAGESAGPGRPLLRPVMRGGARTSPPLPLHELRSRCLARLGELPERLRGLEEEVPYRVRISPGLGALTESVRVRRAGGADSRRP